MEELKERPPYVKFRQEPVEDREASIKNGGMRFKDVHMACITPSGSKDETIQQVEEWFIMLDKEVQEGRFDPRWLEGYKINYKNWVAGIEDTLDGTSVKNWPGLSPSMLPVLEEGNLYTIEDVAAMNEDALNFVGMGGRALKQKALDWLASAKNIGKPSEELGTLRANLKNLEVTNLSLGNKLATLEKELKALKAE